MNPRTLDVNVLTSLDGSDTYVSRFRREAPEQQIPEELLVVQSIKISDKFGFRASQTQSKDSVKKMNKEIDVSCCCMMFSRGHI